jgi:hypothetical protein
VAVFTQNNKIFGSSFKTNVNVQRKYLTSFRVTGMESQYMTCPEAVRQHSHLSHISQYDMTLNICHRCTVVGAGSGARSREIKTDLIGRVSRIGLLLGKTCY